MRVFSLSLFMLAVVASASSSFGAEQPETTRLAFVTEYVRELAAIETIRAAAVEELKQGGKDDVFPNAVYTSTRMQLELKTRINILKGVRLKPPFEKIAVDLVAFYARKIQLYQRLSEISSAFISGPMPGVDFGKLAAEMPQVRAALDDVDHSLFEVTPLIFATLINQKPDSKNHVSHLIITAAERARLLSDITTSFGSKLDQKDQDFTVSAASVLKAYLLKDFKSSDDPWE